MEQIIITRKDGTTYPLAVKREATDIKEARQTWGLLGDDVVNISVESPYPQHYEIGDYFNVFGRTYKLNQLPRVRKLGMHKYAYELTFEGVQYDLLRAFYDVTIETTGNTLQDVQGDALTGNLHRFATVLVSNANRVFPGKWKLGACPDTIADKTLTFGDGDNCLAVYQNLCRTFEVEADITQQDGVYTINFYKRVGTTHPFVLEFGKGKGLYALDRQNVDSSNIVTRLKVFGSDDNITNKYRANRLCLPGKSKAQSFIEQAEAVQKYGIHEARKIFEDIKPTFDGTVTAVVAGSVLQFKDASMFDLNAKEADGKTTKYLVAGVSAKIHFNTGNLAGYEFDIHKYDHATRTFTLKKITDDRGDVFPSETSSAFQFAKGDKYKILDVTLPERYQQEAERKLQERANEYYKQNSQPKVKYGLSVAKSYLKKLFGEDAQVTLFSPGDYINVKDESIGVDKAVRIQSLQRNLLDVYDYTLTISDTAENNITTRVISELIDIDKITTTHNLKDPTRAKANWRSSREVMGMVFDPDGDYYTDKIKPNSIDTLALSVGAKSMQFALQNVVFEPNYQGRKNLVRVSAGTLTHYTIEEQPRMWATAEVITDLPEDESAYYIFARCNKADNAATMVFSKTPIKVEEYANVYHFWIGVVNSVDVTFQARSIALSYGFSMINGRFIKTGRIESANGSTYFDLDDGEIVGNIRFRLPEGEKSITDIIHNITNAPRNLVLRSAYRGGNSPRCGVVGNPTRQIVTSADGNRVWHIQNNGTEQAGIFIGKGADTLTQAIAAGDPIAVSFEVKGTGRWSHLFIENVHQTNTQNPLPTRAGEAIPTEWTRIDLSGINTSELGAMVWYATPGSEFYLRSIKISKADATGIYTEAPEDVDYLLDALQGSTDIQGGLILSSLIGARDTQGEVRSYLSGLSGQRVRDYALATGVTAFGTQNEQAKSWLDFGGNAKFGDLRIGNRLGDGSVWIEDDAGNVRVHLSRAELHSLADMLAERSDIELSGGQTASQTFRNDGGGEKGHFVSLGEITVPADGAGGKLTVNAPARLQLAFVRNGYFRAYVEMAVYRDGVEIANLGEMAPQFMYARSEDGTLTHVQERNFQHTLTNVQPGTYRLSARINTNTDSGNVIITTLSPSVLRYHKPVDKQLLTIAGDGFSVFLNQRTYTHLKDGKFTHVGEMNVPGVLASGTVELSMNKRNTWGAKANNQLATVDSNGIYTVPHGIGHSEYSINVIAHTERLTPVIVSRGNTSFRVKFQNPSGSATQAAFDYQLFGRN